MSSVDESWDRIEKWFQDNGIADQLRPPASAAEIDDMSDEDDEDWSEVEEGEEDNFWGWNPAWLPIAADGGGGYLIVDLREGDRYGVVGRLDPEFPPPFGFDSYPSAAALLEYAATALETS